MGIERQFYSDAAIANLAGDVGNGGSDATILRPRKTFEPQACVLPWPNAAQSCRWIKVCHDPQLPRRYHDPKFVAFVDHSSDPQGRHFAQLSINRSAYPPAIYLFFQSLNGHASRRLIPAQLIEFACKLLDMGFSLVGSGALLTFEAHYRVMQAVGCCSALLGVGYAPVHV